MYMYMYMYIQYYSMLKYIHMFITIAKFHTQDNQQWWFPWVFKFLTSGYLPSFILHQLPAIQLDMPQIAMQENLKSFVVDWRSETLLEIIHAFKSKFVTTKKHVPIYHSSCVGTFRIKKVYANNHFVGEIH